MEADASIPELSLRPLCPDSEVMDEINRHIRLPVDVALYLLSSPKPGNPCSLNIHSNADPAFQYTIHLIQGGETRDGTGPRQLPAAQR